MSQAIDRVEVTPPHEANNGVSNSDPSHTEKGPNPEVVARPKRRTFTAEEKQRILDEVDACKHGEVGAVVRREGITYSTLRYWRRARDLAIATALENRKPGPDAQQPHPLEKRVAELERELEKANKDLAKAHTIIEVQKKVSELLALGSKDDSDESF